MPARSVPPLRGWATAVGSTWVGAAGAAVGCEVVGAELAGAAVADVEAVGAEVGDDGELAAVGALGAGAEHAATSAAAEPSVNTLKVPRRVRWDGIDRDGRYTVTPYYGKSRSEPFESQDGARHFAGLHRPKRLVDVVQPTAPRHQFVQLQP